MQEWNDQAIVLSARPYGESAAILRVLTSEHGLHAGYVHSAQRSGRLRSIVELGNIVNVTWQSKTDGDALGTYQLETVHAIGPHLYEDGQRLLSVQSMCQILDLVLPERESQEALFESSFAYCRNVGVSEHWLAMYVVWEMSLLNALGFGLDLSKCVVTGQVDNLEYISPKSGCAVCAEAGEEYKDKLFPIPDFLKGGGDDSDAEIAKGLAITGHFLQKNVLDEVYKQLPEARQRFFTKLCEQTA